MTCTYLRHHLSTPTNLVRPAIPFKKGGQCFNYDIFYRYLSFRVEVTPDYINLVDPIEFDDWQPPCYRFSHEDRRFHRFLAAVTHPSTLWQMRSAGYPVLSKQIASFRRRTRVPGYRFSLSDKVVLEEFLQFLEPNHLYTYVEVAPPHPCYTDLILPPFGTPLGGENWGSKHRAQGGSAQALLSRHNLWCFTQYGKYDGWVWINLEDALGAFRVVPIFPNGTLDPRLFVPNKLMPRWARA